jgi:hypothetical protein
MKFTPFALAAALALTGATASAAILGAGNTPAADNAEMLLLVWSPTTQSSYVQDLGLTLNTFRANGNTLGYTFSAAATSIYSSSTLAAATDARWAVIGYDTYGDPVPDDASDPSVNNQSLFTTVDKTSAFSVAAPGITADKIANGTSGWMTWTVALNSSGTHPTQANGSSLAVKADVTTYLFDAFNGIGENFAGNFAYGVGNTIGTKSNFYRFSPTDLFDSSVPATVQQFGAPTVAGEWSFDGSAVSYTVGAVPEPGTVALFFAGLAAMGLVVRRRS